MAMPFRLLLLAKTAGALGGSSRELHPARKRPLRPMESGQGKAMRDRDTRLDHYDQGRLSWNQD